MYIFIFHFLIIFILTFTCVSRSFLILSLNIEHLFPCFRICGFTVLYSKAWKMSRHFRSHRCDSEGIDSNLANIQYFAGLYAVLCNEIGRRKATAKEMLPGVFQKARKVFFWKTFLLFRKTGTAAEQEYWRLRLEMESRGRGRVGVFWIYWNKNTDFRMRSNA